MTETGKGRDSRALDRLSKQLKNQAGDSQRIGSKRPPIEEWKPTRETQSGLTITRQGEWLYQGRSVEREPLKALFYGILKREGDRHYLITPEEKSEITVEDAALRIVDYHWSEQDGKACGLVMTSEFGDDWPVGETHALYLGNPVVSRLTNGPSSFQDALYLRTDRGLIARLERGAYYRLAEYIEEGGNGQISIRKGDFWAPIQLPSYD